MLVIRSSMMGTSSFLWKGVGVNRMARRLSFQNVYQIDSWSSALQKCGYGVVDCLSQIPATYSIVQCPSKDTFLGTESEIIEQVMEGTLMTAEEMDLTKDSKGSNRLNLFIGGRFAAKNCLLSAGINSSSISSVQIMKNSFGAPIFPAGWTGSISHKDSIALAAVMPEEIGTIGVDIEKFTHKSANKLLRRLLTEEETKSLGTTFSSEEDVMLRFSFKESIFKALNPLLKRHIGFKEVDVFPQANSTAEIRFHLNGSIADQLICTKYSANWRKFNDYCVTSVIIHK